MVGLKVLPELLKISCGLGCQDPNLQDWVKVSLLVVQHHRLCQGSKAPMRMLLISSRFV